MEVPLQEEERKSPDSSDMLNNSDIVSVLSPDTSISRKGTKRTHEEIKKILSVEDELCLPNRNDNQKQRGMDNPTKKEKHSRLPKEDRIDLSSNLEHIVALGREIEYSTQRYNSWMEKYGRKSKLDLFSEPSNFATLWENSMELKSSGKSHKTKSSVIHSEDMLLYSEDLRQKLHPLKPHIKKFTSITDPQPFILWPGDYRRYRRSRSSTDDKLNYPGAEVHDDEEEYTREQEKKLSDENLDKQWEEEYGDDFMENNNKEFNERFRIPPVSMNRGDDKNKEKKTF